MWNFNHEATVLGYTLYKYEKPKCDCYFPDEKQYGVKNTVGGCQIIACQKPKKAPTQTSSDMKCITEDNDGSK